MFELLLWEHGWSLMRAFFFLLLGFFSYTIERGIACYEVVDLVDIHPKVLGLFLAGPTCMHTIQDSLRPLSGPFHPSAGRCCRLGNSCRQKHTARLSALRRCASPSARTRPIFRR